MKTLAFYNEKGGVGKSTFTIMMASWLKYKHGVNVGVADFNKRLEQYRKDEIKERTYKNLPVIDENKMWPIVTSDSKKITEMERSTHTPMASAFWLEEEIRNGRLQNLDVLFVDLPGAALGKEFLQMVTGQYIGLWIIPLDKELQAFRASIAVKNTLEKTNSTFAGFINFAQKYFRFEEQTLLMKSYMQAGLPVLPDIISASDRMKNISEPDIMRSTISVPNWDSKLFRGARDLGTENLFTDIARLLAKTPDLRGTPAYDMSFVSKLEKQAKGQNMRQLKGSSFPAFEIDTESNRQLT